ncbi:DnaJ domain-containing protein [Radiomyces spectabilis]|uniref:DnaJ domain-containing protein n=1 Tax=Radiomyces spectabilis TaxID=64574 RepID=UPI002220F79C|nr:DnaJ domain-containing protein [Radiomyces spectabilis]KAI8381056.1 DnaJ domain-containing protein [Radiomyces spectabilis]
MRLKGFSSRRAFTFLLIGLLVLATLVPKVKAWEQGDFEIFDLVDELEKSEGKDVNFYSWLNIKPNASPNDIGKAYRKMSLKLHPDKNKSDKKAKERFARLGKIAAILRNPASRERYNFFYKNGVPRWRGTGYLYQRFRPGVGFVLGFLFVVIAAMQYMTRWIIHYREKSKIKELIDEARSTMHVNMPKGHTAPSFGRSYVTIGQRALRCEVKSDTYIIVYPEGEHDPVHLDISSMAPPRIWELYIFRWPVSLYYKVSGKKHPVPAAESEEEGDDDDRKADVDTDETQGQKAAKKKKKSEKVAVTGSKVGGRRRAVKKNQ